MTLEWTCAGPIQDLFYSSPYPPSYILPLTDEMAEAQGGKVICPESLGKNKKDDEHVPGARRDPGLCFVLFVHSANVYCADENEN